MDNITTYDYSNSIYLPNSRHGRNKAVTRKFQPKFDIKANKKQDKTIFTILAILTLGVLAYVLTKGKKAFTKLPQDTPSKLPNNQPTSGSKNIEQAKDTIKEAAKETTSSQKELNKADINEFSKKPAEILSNNSANTTTTPSKIANTTEKILKSEITPDFKPVKGGEVGRRLGEEDVFFYANDKYARPNIQQDSFFEEFREVPRLSDEVAAQRLKKAEQEIQSDYQKMIAGTPLVNKNSSNQKDINTIYQTIRHTYYPPQTTLTGLTQDYDKIISTNTEGISQQVRQNGIWCYRYPKKISHNAGPKCRISLNAKIDEELIHKLDKYLLDNNITAQYKIPTSLYKACQRADTYTIYFYDDITPKIQKDICNIAKPYIRTGNDKIYPIGQELEKGIYYSPKEPTKEDTRDFIKTLYAINPNLAKNILARTDAYKWNNGLSIGQIEAAKIFLRKLLEP